MGGRGASAGGRESGGGKLDPSDILSTSEMITQRGERQAEVDAVLSVLRDFNNEYGTVIGEAQVATLAPGTNAMAYFDGDNIAVNESYFNNARMQTAYDSCVDSGYHPSRGKKSAMEAVAAHEVGHKLTADVAVKMGRKSYDIDGTAEAVVKEARKQTKHKGVVQMSRKISRYATTSNAEAVAEAVSDVYCNGSKARAESRAIVGVLNKYLKS